ncbi:MAG: biotin--[acetyl-CoA-carboxylase] ligase [Verrucomicrobiota bacterium]|nr:biotin--[acetyl-CoA-carboxylase] ligase [Verrucomicrobiota bacterium]
MKHIRLDTIDSTNNYAKEHAATFSPSDITCITAEEQIAGRGRFQRIWQSPRGVNLYATFYFRLPSNTPHLISLAQVLASSLATLLLNNRLQPKIKWPNDILLNGKKLSGVLCETRFQGDHVDIFLGIGININMEAADLATIDKPATSLKVETGRSWNRDALLHSLQKQFSCDLDAFKHSGFTPFHSMAENLLAFKGQTIRCSDGKKEWTGICHSLTNDGQLNLYLPDHTMHTLSSGDIEG